MPKGKRKPSAGLRFPSLRGVVTVSEYYGKPVVKKWPRPRGPNRHPTNEFWTRWLQGVTYLYRYQPSKFQGLMMAATANTPWMARDPFISGARGRSWAFTDQNGRTYYPMPAVNAVSQSLDALSQIEGKMLMRGPTRWEGVDPPASGSPLEAWPAPSSSALIVSACHAGLEVNLQETIELQAIGYYGNIASGATYRAFVCTLDGSNNIDWIQSTPDWTQASPFPTGTPILKWHEFTTPVVLAAGTTYYLLAGRVSGTPTVNSGIMAVSANVGPFNLPLEGAIGSRRAICAVSAPTIGSAVARSNAAGGTVAIRFTRP